MKTNFTQLLSLLFAVTWLTSLTAKPNTFTLYSDATTPVYVVLVKVKQDDAATAYQEKYSRRHIVRLSIINTKSHFFPLGPDEVAVLPVPQSSQKCRDAGVALWLAPTMEALKAALDQGEATSGVTAIALDNASTGILKDNMTLDTEHRPEGKYQAVGEIQETRWAIQR